MIDGTNAFALGDKSLSKFRNELIGFVFHFHHLLPEFTALENICIPGLIDKRCRWKVEKKAATLRCSLATSTACLARPNLVIVQCVGYEQADYVKPDFAVDASPIGTSFPTPVITGLCAALLEYRPMQRDSLIVLLHASGSKAATPDREIGYGVPQTGKLLKLLDNER